MTPLNPPILLTQSVSLLCQLILLFAASTAQAETISPPQNSYAPNSSWSEGHGCYAQQWTSAPGPVAGDSIKPNILRFDREEQGFMPTGTMLSEPDSRGNYSFWGTNGKILYKVVISGRQASLQIADRKALGFERLSGYWAMDRNNVVYILDSGQQEIVAVTHANPKDYTSGFRVVSRFRVPKEFIQSNTIDYPTNTFADSWLLKKDGFLGIKILYSGQLVVATRYGRVMVISRDFQHYQSINLGEPLDNSMAVEEDGGIYLTTFRRLLRLVWTGQNLRVDWSVNIGGRSGSTPTLVGVGPHDDRLVAITTNDRPMELLLVWRHNIPANWKGIPNNARRVAARVPVTYGRDPSHSHFTENSLLVYGYGILAANWTGMFPRLQEKNPGVARYDWNPLTRTLDLRWFNSNLWLPNSMQGMSSATQLVYAVGVQTKGLKRQYGLYGIRWGDGTVAFFAPLGDFRDRALNIVGSGIQIGPNREVITMSPLAVILLQP